MTAWSTVNAPPSMAAWRPVLGGSSTGMSQVANTVLRVFQRKNPGQGGAQAGL